MRGNYTNLNTGDYVAPTPWNGGLNQLDPNRDTFPAMIRDIQNRLNNIELARQQYQGDWTLLNSYEYTYLTANTIGISTFTPSDKFAIGDKLRIKQGGSTYNYYKITAVNTLNIEISAGTGTAFSSSTITDIGYSKLETPTGFPIKDDWDNSFLNPSKFAYSTANTITVTDFDPRNVFAVGDRLRLKQGGAYKYYKITALSATTIEISAGTGTALTNTTITEIGYSKYQYPLNFPATVTDDWDNSYLNPSKFTYSTANLINVSGIDATTVFTVGDRLRIKQGGSYLYYLVTGVTSSTLEISAGTGTALANSTITEIGRSKFTYPVGFPTSVTDDWQNSYLNPTKFTYSSAVLINCAYDPRTQFTVGDKIRIKQGGSYLYFYVVSLSASQIGITGGTSYTFANSTITEIGLSKTATPVGFPEKMTYTPTVTLGSGTINVEQVKTFYFWMVGNTVYVNGKYTATITAPGTWSPPITISLPITNTSAQQFVHLIRREDSSVTNFEVWQATLTTTNMVVVELGGGALIYTSPTKAEVTPLVYYSLAG